MSYKLEQKLVDESLEGIVISRPHRCVIHYIVVCVCVWEVVGAC